MRIKSFSLIEVLLYLSMVSIIVLTVSVLLSGVLSSRIKTQVFLEVESQGQQILDQISQSISEAGGIITPAAGLSGQVLSLQGTLGGSVPATYQLESSNLTINQSGQPSRPLNNSKIIISNLNFTNSLNPGSAVPSIRVFFTITSYNPSNRNEYFYQKNFQTTATLDL